MCLYSQKTARESSQSNLKCMRLVLWAKRHSCKTKINSQIAYDKFWECKRISKSLYVQVYMKQDYVLIAQWDWITVLPKSELAMILKLFPTFISQTAFSTSVDEVLVTSVQLISAAVITRFWGDFPTSAWEITIVITMKVDYSVIRVSSTIHEHRATWDFWSLFTSRFVET